MDQHPVPQNVTTFQFRLIGDMTIKQFGYLAGGAILAYVAYKLPLPFFFSWPLTTIFALGGVGFAFVPIEERPMDVWVLSFLKNVYSPTVYTWAQSVPQQQSQQGSSVRSTVPQHLPQSPMNYSTGTPPTRIQTAPVDVKTTASVVGTMYAPNGGTKAYAQPISQKTRSQEGMFDWIFDLFKPKSVSVPIKPAVPTQAPHIATPQVVGSHLDISMPPTIAPHPPKQKPVVEPISNVSTQKQSENLQSSTHQLVSEAKISDLQKQLAEALAQKEKISQDMPVLAPQKATTIPTPAVRQPQQAPSPVPTQKQPTVKIITPEGAVRAGLPRLTTFPNVVTGITKDSDNNFLPGVLVTVKDKDGIPVRALKTNRLGQFAASTPLSNGVYFVEIEDPRQRYTFDRVQITLNGSIVPALEIITKSQKQISRDKLAKELFGNTTQ